MNFFLGAAIYIITWWLVFFTVLPMGARSLHEGGDDVPRGSEPGSPKSHDLGKKALIAAAIAAVVWLGVAWAITNDIWNMRG